MKSIYIEAFDKESVQHAIREVKAVKYEWKEKAKRCANEVARAIATQAYENLASIPWTDDVIDIGTHTPMQKQGMFPVPSLFDINDGCKVVFRGEDIVFVEFGAGVYHNGNGSQNPLSGKVQFETSIGSYGKGQGNKPYWFIAHNLISHGTPMYMPIQNAIEQVKPMIPTIVRQVFV